MASPTILLPPVEPARRRIVITGLGVVSCAGRTVNDFWRSLTSCPGPEADGGPAVQPVTGVADFEGTIDDFGELAPSTRKAIRKALKLMNRETQMGVAVGQQALTESDVLRHCSPERVGVCFGADSVSISPHDFAGGVQACRDEEGEFDIDRWGTDGITQVAPLWLLKCLPNMTACHLAIINNLQGPGNTITQRDVAANMAVAEACRVIADGEVDAMLVGATGTTLAPFNQMHARLETDVDESPESPVDGQHGSPRDANVPGEGAGAIVLEEREAALRRGASIYGEVLAAASASFIGTDGAASCGRALASAMRQCLRRGNLSTEVIGHIHAHGAGTRRLEVAESETIRELLGEPARRIPIVATKSRLANTGAAAGALELIASLLALKNGRLFGMHDFGETGPQYGSPVVDDTIHEAGSSFLNVNLFSRGIASCVAVALDDS